MGKEKLDMMVEGGKAVTGPSVAQKLGPMKVNIPDVLSKINEKTAAFKGMQVPVKLIIDTETKQVDITIGTPPTSELIKKELGLEKGSGEPNKKKIGNMSIEQVIKIAKMKQDSFFTKNLKSIVKCVIGSASSLGVLVEGKIGGDLVPKIDGGKFKEEIEKEKTETTEEKKIALGVQLVQVQKELEKELARLEAEMEKEKKTEPKPAEVKAEVKEGEGKPGEVKAEEGKGKPGEGKPEGKGKEAAPAKAAPKSEEKKK